MIITVLFTAGDSVFYSNKDELWMLETPNLPIQQTTCDCLYDSHRILIN